MRKSKGFLIVCSCGCKAQLQIQKIEDDLFLVDTRIDGRRRWIGVTLKSRDIKKVRDFLDSKT